MIPPPKTIHRGRVIDLVQEWVELPDRSVSLTDVVKHPGGAVALPLDERRRVLMLRQFRPCLRSWLWELPAGKIDPGETPEATVRRELAEEAGLEARSWRKLAEIVTAPGFCDEVLHIYLATELRPVGQNTEDDEFIELHWMDFSEALVLADNGGIRDAKTLVALYRAMRSEAD